DILHAIAVGEAKEPGKDFDRSSGERTPVRQVYDYMIDAQTRWGILTDGRRWRLVHRDSPKDTYFEVDLHGVSARRDTGSWLVFYNLFRREAFVPRQGGSFLDAVKNESIRYSRQIGEELKDRAYSALRELARGFASWSDNRLDVSNEHVRDKIRDASFILLYLLLFVFYAEARGLLPRDASGYRETSLEAVREEVLGASNGESRFSANSRRIWSKLKDLFRLIDQGN